MSAKKLLVARTKAHAESIKDALLLGDDWDTAGIESSLTGNSYKRAIVMGDDYLDPRISGFETRLCPDGVLHVLHT